MYLFTKNPVKIHLIISALLGETAIRRNEVLHRYLLGGDDSED